MSKEKRAVLFAFSVQSSKFDSNSERNKFFRMLYGWKQTVPKGKKEYVYERKGMLDEMPHEKVDQSSFIVQENDFNRMEKFFDEWSNKVIWKTFKVLMDKNMKDVFEGFGEDDEEEEPEEEVEE